MMINWHKVNNVLHRDVGYFFFGMTIIYALSGIALNHISDWDPNYIIRNEKVQVEQSRLHPGMSKQEVMKVVEDLGIDNKFKKHYYPNTHTLKIFIDGGSVTLDTQSGHGTLESVTRRPVFYEINYMHYNHTKFLWTWFSDIFAGGLVLLAITGLFVLKGKNGLKRRGVWFVVVGIIIPLIFIMTVLLSIPPDLTF
ncbi:MAG: PepSY-associated TM helix domain-containing protein [Cyclobacteriaceae bacterium]|nr:PepSY-associated TM helix domain-containing protein [Cyclobacteriaceae bacterium]